MTFHDSFYCSFLLLTQEEIQSTLHGKWDISDAITSGSRNNRYTQIWQVAAVFADAVCIIIQITKVTTISVYKLSEALQLFILPAGFMLTAGFSLLLSFDIVWWAMSAKIVRHNRLLWLNWIVCNENTFVAFQVRSESIALCTVCIRIIWNMRMFVRFSLQ